MRGVLCAVAALALVAPLAVVVLISVSAGRFLRFPPPGLSLQWYRALFSDPGWLDSLGVSAAVLVPAALAATGLGTAATYGLARGGVRAAGVLWGVLLLPLVVPGVVTAAALFGAYARLGLNGTLAGLVLAHVVLTLPYVVATVGAALRTLDPMLEGAAATLGAGPWRAFRRVTLPLLAPAVLGGALFAAVVSFDELIVSLFVSSARVQPVAVRMWGDVLGDFDPVVAAISTVALGLALLGVIGEAVLRRRMGR